jgi:hypothetical protein
MTSVCAFLDANTTVAMIKRGLGIIISSKSGSRQTVSLLNYYLQVQILFATLITQAS